MTDHPPIDQAVRQVICPSCSGPSVYASSNPHRPFCSERCKKIDLGAWASEQFVLPAATPPEEPELPVH